MYRLYGMPGAASLAPHIVLEEIGAHYEFIKLDGEKKEHKSADYLKLNPHGRVPTLIDGDNVIYESAAICLFLAEAAQSDLLPSVASAERAQLYKWLMFLTNTLQPSLMAYFYPDRLTTDASHAPAIKERAEQNANEYFRQLNIALAEHGPYLGGKNANVADFFALMMVRWGRWFAHPPVKQFAHIGQFVELMSATPSVQRAFAQEGIPAPYCLIPPK
jgi:glutathione S-transferase